MIPDVEGYKEMSYSWVKVLSGSQADNIPSGPEHWTRRPPAMDVMVEENGTGGSSGGDPLAHSPGDNGSVVVTSVQSVIQANQQSVIQTPSNIQLQKGNVILVSKPNSVIQTTQGSLQTLQVVDATSDDSLSNDDESTKKRRDILTRRPSYRKILNDLGGGEIAGHVILIKDERLKDHQHDISARQIPASDRASASGSNWVDAQIGSMGRVVMSSDCDEDSDLSSHSIPTHYQTVIPAGAIQISSQGETVQGLHTLTMTNATTAGGAIVQYAQGQDGQFFVPVVTQGGGLAGGPIIAEDQARKREMRLLKNREAARECRRKKKEYIKCLENRVAVLENQNKALIDELKTLKELYCQTKTE